MKALLSICTFMLVLGSPVKAQNELDSLKRVIHSTNSDTVKIKGYNRLSYLYNYHYPDLEKARSYADSAVALATLTELSDWTMEARYHLALVDSKDGNYVQALDKLQAYVDYHFQNNDSAVAIRAMYTMAIIYGHQGDLAKKMELQLLTTQYYDARGQQSNLGRSLLSLGGTYRQLEMYSQAKNTLLKAVEIFRQTDRSLGYPMALQNLANLFISTEQFDSAAYLYEQALAIIRNQDRKVEEAYILNNLGFLSQTTGDYPTALNYYQETLKTWRALEQPKDVAEALSNIGSVYYHLAEYAKAESHFNEALSIAQSIGSKKLQADLYQDLSQLHAARSDYQQALAFTTLSHQLSDSIFSEENAAQVNELQAKYEAAEKDKRIAVLGREKEIQEKEAMRQATLKKAFIAAGSLIALIAALVLVVFWQRTRNQKLIAFKNQELKEAKFQRQLSDLEMKALQAQINPHFIFNCLNSINQMILEGEDVQASRYLTKFSKLIRLILENSESSEIPLQDELEVLESYIELEQLRYQGEIDYQLNVHQDLDPADTYLPAMVLQPFVENAIWHGLGLRPERQGGKITIAAKQEGNWLKCEIEDNGVGREYAKKLKDQSLVKRKSMGLKITEERLSLLSPDKESDQQLINIVDLKDDQGVAQGTRVEVAIPT